MIVNLDEFMIKSIDLASEKYLGYSYTFDCLRYELIDDPLYTMSMNKDLVLKCGKQLLNRVNNIEDVSELVTHEILHYLLNHFVRYDQNIYRDILSFETHNICMDLEINQYLHSDWVSKNGWLPRNENYPEGLSYEEYLHLLKSDIENNTTKNNLLDKLKNNVSIPMVGTIEKPEKGLSNSDIEDIESSIEKMIEMNQSRLENSGIGNNTQKTVGTLRIVKPKKYPWYKIIDRITSDRLSDKTFGFDYVTYATPNRRFNNSDIIFPSKYSENKELNLVIGIDISGSMGELVNELYSRLKTLTKSVQAKIDTIVLECDTEIKKVVRNFDFDSQEVYSEQGFGTNLDAIFNWVSENEEPDAIIIMTDNEYLWKEPIYENKTYIITSKISKNCPYKQYEVNFESRTRI